MSLLALSGTNSAVAGGYDIANSVKLEQPERLNRGYDGAGNIGSITATDRKKTTLSYWVKRTQLNASGNGIVFIMYAGNTIMLGFEQDKLRVSASYGYSLISNALFRDTSAWYHLVFSIDTTQGTANDRVKVYVNGAEYTDWSTQSITISQNANNGMFNEVNGGHYFGWSDSQATGCYVAEAHCIDGQALAASDFGEYDSDSGIWIPKEYEGTYGNQGYYLDFKNASNLGEDQSGNGNDFGTFYGGGAENQATDTPTNNFCIMSPLWKYATSSTLTNGGTYISTTTAGWTGAKGSIGVQNGKWYWEVKTTNAGWSLFPAGIQTDGEDNINSGNAHSQNTTMALGTGGTYIKYVSGSESSVSTGGAGMSNNNITGVALDLDSATKTLKWYKNNSLISTVNIETVSASFGNQLVFPFSSIYADSGTVFIEYNFGGYTSFSISSAETDENGYGTFEYAPPSGYYALCTKNLAEYG